MEVTLLRVNQLGSQSSAFKIESVLFFVALASLFGLFVALAKLKVTQRNSVNPAEARAHQTRCTAMF